MRRRSARGLLRAAVVAVVTLNIFFAFYVGTYLKSGVAHKAATEDNVPRPSSLLPRDKSKYSAVHDAHISSLIDNLTVGTFGDHRSRQKDPGGGDGEADAKDEGIGEAFFDLPAHVRGTETDIVDVTRAPRPARARKPLEPPPPKLRIPLKDGASLVLQRMRERAKTKHQDPKKRPGSLQKCAAQDASMSVAYVVHPEDLQPALASLHSLLGSSPNPEEFHAYFIMLAAAGTTPPAGGRVCRGVGAYQRASNSFCSGLPPVFVHEDSEEEEESTGQLPLCSPGAGRRRQRQRRLHGDEGAGGGGEGEEEGEEGGMVEEDNAAGQALSTFSWAVSGGSTGGGGGGGGGGGVGRASGDGGGGDSILDSAEGWGFDGEGGDGEGEDREAQDADPSDGVGGGESGSMESTWEAPSGGTEEGAARGCRCEGQVTVVWFDPAQYSVLDGVRSARGEAAALDYAVLFLDELLLPIGVDKVLVLDTDTIVQGNVRELFAPHPVDKDMKILAAAEACGRTLGEAYNFNRPTVLSILGKGASKQCAVDPGVLVLDVARYKELGMRTRATDLLVRSADDPEAPLWLNGAGGEALVLLLFQHLRKIEPRWNLADMGSKSDLRGAQIAYAAILHWSGPRKPWMRSGLYRGNWKKWWVALPKEPRPLSPPPPPIPPPPPPPPPAPPAPPPQEVEPPQPRAKGGILGILSKLVWG